MLFVTLGYLSFVLSSGGVHGLPEKVSTGLHTLRDNQELAIVTRFRGHYPIYDIIFASIFKYLHNFEREPSSDDLGAPIVSSSLGQPIETDPRSTSEKVINATAVLATISDIIISGNIAALDDLPKIENVLSVGNSTALLVEANRIDKIALFYMVDKIPFSLNKFCRGLSDTKNAIRLYVDVIYLVIAFLMDSTFNGVYPANQAILKVIVSVSPIIVDDMIKRIYDLFRTCSNTKDADMLSLINDNEMQSQLHLRLSATAILSACAWYTSYVASGNRNADLISHVEECEAKTLGELREEMNHICLVREVFYLKSRLHNTSRVVVSHLAANQNATMVRIHSNREAIETFYNEILSRVRRMEFRIVYDSELVFSRTDVVRTKTAENLINGNDLFIELISLLYPNSSSSVTKARKTLNDMLNKIAAIYFEMMELALDDNETFSNVTTCVSSKKAEAVGLYQKVINVSMSLIRNGQNLSGEIETQYVDLKNVAANAVADLVQSIANAVLILAELVRKNGTSSIDYTTAIESIKKSEEQGILSFYNEADSLSQAFLLFIIKY